MTTITINLLVAEQLNEQAKARDPFKIAIAAGTGLLAITVVIGVIVGQMADKKKMQAGTLQAKWDSIQATQSGPNGSDTKGLQALANDYLAINQSRALYAPQLALIKDVIPDTVQLTQIRFAVTTEVSSQPDAPADASAAKAARLSKPKTTERMNLILEGSAICARPEIEVDQFIKSLKVHPVFSAFVKDVRLRSISRAVPSSDPNVGAQSSAIFVIECLYKESK